MFPALSVATPPGLLNRTSLPIPLPLVAPLVPANPANVITPFVGVIFLTVLLPISATYRLPWASTARPWGFQNRASLPFPSVLPGWPGRPATVLTVPSGAILRIVLLALSET